MSKFMSEPDLKLGDIAYHSPAMILAHPRFAEARADYVDAALALYQGDAFLTRLVQEAGRTVIFIVILCLYARYDEADPKTWPTLALLKQQMTQFGLSSPRRVEALVARLIDADFLQAARSQSDGRVRILTPTEIMYRTDQDWLAAHYLPLQVLFPDPGYGGPMRRDAAFQQAQRLASLDFLGHGANIMAGNPGIMLFMGRDAGMMILIRLVQRAGDRSSGPVDVSFEETGAQFGVSRTHVRMTLQDAERAGLVALSGPGRRLVELRPAAWDAFDRFLAESMSGLDLLFEIAQRQMKNSGPR
jgi:DNA-binding MarR family transcriptional regulator